MRTVERDFERIVTLLRSRMRERGYTQIEVQEILGWGRSYISQLLHKNKSLRVEQVLMILNVIGVKPEDFWAEIYRFGAFCPPTRARRGVSRHSARGQPDASDDAAVLAALRRTRRLFEGVVTVLKRKNLITAGELDGATNKFRQTP